MKKLLLRKFVPGSLLLIAGIFYFSSANAQVPFQSKSVAISLTGTSTLHDWEMKAGQGKSESAFTIDANNKIIAISKLSFTLPAKSLKSEHTMMDKNTYKALDTDKNPNISFVLTSGTVTPTSNNNYQLHCVGKLTIAGTTKTTDLTATGTYNPADKTFTITGVKAMKMTDYNVKPPTVMMGTIKTGNDISIAYNVKFAH
ncbi:MAG: YceI family protein [Bacteroidota bacterium]